MHPLKGSKQAELLHGAFRIFIALSGREETSLRLFQKALEYIEEEKCTERRKERDVL